MNFKLIFNGRLGNQMFQYAFSYRLSKEYNCKLYYNKKVLLHKLFNIPFHQNNLEFNTSIHESIFFEDNILKDDNYLIQGFWQNEKYFKKYKNDLIKLYKLPQYKISSQDLIIHVRRGDYVNNLNFFYCDLNWYNRAISKFNFDRLHIISDDNNWCKEAFKVYNPIIPELNELSSLGYLSSFKNIIISNSSFSWWGAYLSNTTNIIYPAIWRPPYPNNQPGLKIWKSLV